MRLRVTQIHCDRCQDLLAGKPKIDVEGKVYCYRCAKSKVKTLERSRQREAEEKCRTDKARYDSLKGDFDKKYSEWVRERREYIDPRRWDLSWAFAFVVIFGGIGWYISTGYAWGGALIGFCLWAVQSSNVEKKLDMEFRNKVPEPIFLETIPTLIVPEVDHYLLPPDGTRLGRKNYREEILLRDGQRCQSCGMKLFLAQNFEVHHIIPKSQGGADDPTNLITLCLHCHDREDWYSHVRIYPTTTRKKRNRTLGEAILEQLRRNSTRRPTNG